MTDDEARSIELIDFFLQNPNTLSQFSHKDCQDVLLLATRLASDTSDNALKERCYILLYQLCLSTELHIKELWNIYWILSYSLFSDYSLSFSGHRDVLYRFIFQKIKNLLPSYAPYEKTASNLVILITSQFLNEDHAPTRRILDYTYTIHTKLGKNVLIINDAGLHFYLCRCIVQEYSFSYTTKPESWNYYLYKDLAIPFAQLSFQMPDLYGLKDTLDFIYSKQPELVYNIGGSSLLADLCGQFTKTCCFPCSTDIPVSMSQYLLVGRNLLPSDSERLKRLEPYQQVIETVVNYQLPELTPSPYTREQFGLTADHFVFGLIGNRLDTEITDDFLQLINKIINTSNAHFLLIGEVPSEHILAALDAPENVHFAGGLKNAYLAVTLFDVYCNPKRNGGGRSSFEALAQDVPVLTLAYGDVYYTCGDSFGVPDEAAYLDTALRYTKEPSFLAEQKKLCGLRAAQLSDIAGTQGAVFDKIFS